MKFFTFIAAAIPLASTMAIPPAIEADQRSDTLDVINKLLDEEKIDIPGGGDLAKRWDVPGLNCGSKRAIRCAQNSPTVVANCMWAIINFGLDVKDDTKCMGSIIDERHNLPEDCKLCLSNIIHD